jgi:hypothetical protein
VIIAFVRVNDSEEMDRITLENTGTPEYTTGAGRGTVEQMLDKYGRVGAMTVLKEWGNGYVATREIVR